jgi:type IV secretory pathway VirB2 component (pilin)
MTSYATEITHSAAPPRDRTGPVVALVSGSIAAFLAFILIAAAGVLIWTSHFKTDDAGYYTAKSHTFATPTRALTTENLDAATGMPDWLDASDHLGRVRIDPQGTGAFVGIARTRDVNRYLDGVAHDEITDVDLDPFRIETARRPGEGRPAMPAAQTFWAATSTRGRTLEWKVRKGNWTVVTMNADGSPNVRVAAKVGAKVPLLGELGWILAIPGVLLGAAAIALVAVGARGISRSRQPGVMRPLS